MGEGESGPEGEGPVTQQQEEFPQCEEMEAEVQEDKPEIDQSVVNEFVGEVPNLFKIDSHYLFNQRFRINVWVVYRFPDRLVPDYVIHASYFVKMDDSGEIIDETIHEKKGL